MQLSSWLFWYTSGIVWISGSLPQNFFYHHVSRYMAHKLLIFANYQNHGWCYCITLYSVKLSYLSRISTIFFLRFQPDLVYPTWMRRSSAIVKPFRLDPGAFIWICYVWTPFRSHRKWKSLYRNGVSFDIWTQNVKTCLTCSSIWLGYVRNLKRTWILRIVGKREE